MNSGYVFGIIILAIGVAINYFAGESAMMYFYISILILNTSIMERKIDLIKEERK